MGFFSLPGWDAQKSAGITGLFTGAPGATQIYLANLRYNVHQSGCKTLQNHPKTPTLHPALPLAVAQGSICSRMNCLCIKPLSGPTRVSRLLSMRKPKSERVLWGLVCSMDHFWGDATRPHGSGECAMILVTSGIIIAYIIIQCGLSAVSMWSRTVHITPSSHPVTNHHCYAI